MMQKRGVFFDEWRRCLQEHYLHVIRTRDQITERTLREVMLENDFTEEQLEELQTIGICQDEKGMDDPECRRLYQQLVGEEWVEEPLPEPLQQQDLFALAGSLENRPKKPPVPKKPKSSDLDNIPDQLTLL